MNIVDNAIEARKERDAQAAAAIQARLAGLKAKLDPPAAKAGTRLADSRQYIPVCQQTIAKAHAAGHGDDLAVSGAVFNLRNLINGVSALEAHLKEYQSLTVKNLTSEDGEFDANKERQIFSTFSARFAPAGGRKAMERAVKLIESRIAQLEANRQWEAAHGIQRKQPIKVEIPRPRSKPIKVVSDFDARQD